jgi:hypothetical protein
VSVHREAARLPRLRLAACACVAAATLAAAPALHAQARPSACALSGRVARPDGTPLAGATLSARAAGPAVGDWSRAPTDAKGRFCLDVPRGGEYLLVVERQGFVERSLRIPLAPGAGARLPELRLTPGETARWDRSPPGSDAASAPGLEAALYARRSGDLVASAGVELAALAPAGAVQAPEAPPPCSVSGRVAMPDGGPLAGATLRVRATAPGAGEWSRAPSDADGRFCLSLPAGGEYLLVVEHDGFLGRSLLVEVAAGAEARLPELRLTPDEALRLEPVVAQAPRRTPPSPRRGTPPGSDVASMSGGEAALYPGTSGDLVASAGVAGQYVPVGQDLSVEGQAPTGNRTTLDGSGFDARDVPAEGLAAAGVFAHPYDVSRGQFTGGEIAGRTMGGTNVWGGALRVSLEPPWLAYGAGPRGGGDVRARQALLSAGGGGPLLPGRLFVYGAAQADARTAPAPGLGRAGPGLRGYGLPADSVQRFFEVLQRLGVEPGENAGARQGRSGSAVARIDYVPGPRHALMLRLDGRGRESSGGSGSPLGTGSAAREESRGGGALLQLTSRAGRAENELTLRRSAATQRVRRTYEGPAGEVWVGAGGEGGGFSGASLAFGGEPLGFPPEERGAAELGERLVLTLGGGAHQLQLGGSWQRERVERTSDANRLGTFTFASLAELEAGRPVRFTRALGERTARVTTGYAALYAGDSWKIGGLRLAFGVRGERYGYSGGGDADPAADSAFGVRGVPAASRWSASPRAGFSWFHTTPATQFGVQGGTGLFRGAAPTRLLAALLAQGGGAAVGLVCVGAAVPAPRWADYLENPGAIPDRCAGEAAEVASPPAGATGFSADYAPPRVWHSSLGATWLHKPTATGIELRLGASRGRGLALAADRNLVADPRFVLEAEGGRPVYVSPSAIDAASGQVSRDGSRGDGRFGIVREVSGGGRSSVELFSLAANRLTGRGLFELYYTFTRSRDQRTGLAGPEGGWATTAADPRAAEWAASDFEQRHAFQLSLIRQLGRWGSVTAVGRLVSGTPYTPVIDGDVNGDGMLNDRAFIFDPATLSDPRLRGEMEALLRGLPGSARACLLRQAGTIAARNSCRTPWGSFLDLQLNVFPQGPRNKRVVVNVAAENVTSGLDYLLHHGGTLHGWGQSPSADPVLLRAVGFDADRREFRYAVNPGFGPDAGRVTGVNFSFRIQARVTLGADPAMQALVAQVVMSQDRLEAGQLRAAMLRRWLNVPAAVLAYDAGGRLRLTPQQTSMLRAAADSIADRSDGLATALAEAITQLGATAPSRVREALARQRHLQDEAQALLEGGSAAARSTLAPGQWERLPGHLRAPVHVALPINPPGGVQLLPDF